MKKLENIIKNSLKPNGEPIDGYYTGPSNDEDIISIEQLLSVHLPEDYKWFLKHFGSGGSYGVLIFGIGKVQPPKVVKETQNWRKLGLPKHFVVIEDCDEWVTCLNTQNYTEGKCPVVAWSPNDSVPTFKAESFEEYLSNSFRERIQDCERYQNK